MSDRKRIDKNAQDQPENQNSDQAKPPSKEVVKVEDDAALAGKSAKDVATKPDEGDIDHSLSKDSGAEVPKSTEEHSLSNLSNEESAADNFAEENFAEDENTAPQKSGGLKRVIVIIIVVLFLILSAIFALPRLGVQLPEFLSDAQKSISADEQSTADTSDAATSQVSDQSENSSDEADSALDDNAPSNEGNEENASPGDENAQSNAVSPAADDEQSAESSAESNANTDEAQLETANETMQQLKELTAGNAALLAEIEALKAENANLSGQVQTLEVAQATAEDRLQQAEAEAQTQIETAIREAKASAFSPEKAQALSELYTNANQGMDISSTLARLRDLDVEIPDPVASITSVPKASDLQGDFNNYALEAVRASIKVQPSQGIIDTLMRPFRTEFASRSIVPILGNSPDAVLSRAEASMRNGNLEDALNTVLTLPSESRDVMQPWIEQAEIRVNGLFVIEEFINSQLVGGS